MTDKTSITPVWCTIGDGPRHEFIFPTAMIQASTTGGRREVLGFFHRLNVARRVIDWAPDFKLRFAQHFQPLVLTVACQLIAGQALRAIARRISIAPDEALESIKECLGKFPF